MTLVPGDTDALNRAAPVVWDPAFPTVGPLVSLRVFLQMFPTDVFSVWGQKGASPS